MSVSQLSPSTQDYLKAIWALSEWSTDPVTPSRIAERIGVTTSTVSITLGKLAKQGLCVHERYGAVTLTSEGEQYALAMVRRHRIIETFLVDALGYTWDEIHDEAEQLEHAVSDRLVERMDEHLGFPSRDPHGDPIPSSTGKLSALDSAVMLYDVPLGSHVKVERVDDDYPELLREFTRRGISVGSELTVLDADPLADTIRVEVDRGGEPVMLGVPARRSLWVTPVRP